MKTKKRNPQATSIQEVFLANAGISSLAEASAWLKKGREGSYHIRDMQAAVDFVKQYKDGNVVVCGDYDADGVSGTYILCDALKEYGFKSVGKMIPERTIDGFGLNQRMVEAIAKDYEPTNTCILTVDNGVQADDAMELAHNYGMGVVVLDHHEAINPRFEADVTVDPSEIKDSADFSGYCGAGLAYKFAAVLLGRENAFKYLPIAAIATIADVMELREENYFIVKQGLFMINNSFMGKGSIPLGLRALIMECVPNDALQYIDEQTVGFKIAPAINAPGRIDHERGAMMSVDLLMSESPFLAALRAKEVKEINEKRKEMQAKAEIEIDAILEQMTLAEEPKKQIHIIWSKEADPGIVGPLAGRVMDKTGSSAIVFAEHINNPDLLVGSGRSVEGVHLKNLLEKGLEFTVKCGGHERAAGMTVEKSKFEDFKTTIQEALMNQDLAADSEDADTTWYDLEIQASQVPVALDEVKRYAPYGQGNPPIVFKVVDFHVKPDRYNNTWVRELAKNGVKLQATSGIEALSFEVSDRLNATVKAEEVVLYGSLAANHFRGKTTPQISFSDFEIVG